MSSDLFADDRPATISAISLWQPWASLIFAPTQPKRHETRSWAYPLGMHRSMIAIHAAQKRVPEALITPELAEICLHELGPRWREEVPYGAIIGTVQLGGCVHTQMVWPDDDDRVCGDWSPGRFAWELLYPWQIERDAVPWKGRQGWFFVPTSSLPAEAFGYA
jgi:hypothetical protein